jgi:putative lipoic acid-binding regulatory protein
MIGPSSLIEYPCDFPIKIMGHADTLAGQVAVSAEHTLVKQSFPQAVLTIVKRHAPDFDDTTMAIKISKKGTYLSLTCTIRAVSRSQLDALYQELCDHPLVVMAL